MNAYDAYCLFVAVKTHFTNKKFNLLKYNKKTNVKYENFENRKDKYIFNKLSKKFNDSDEMCFFLGSIFLEKPNVWSGELLTDESVDVFLKHKKITESLSYFFKNDCDIIFNTVEDKNDVFKVREGQHPLLLSKTLSGEVNVETLIILNDILNFFPRWERKISDTIVWPDFKTKCEKYSAFIKYDKEKMKAILKNCLNNCS